MDEDQIQVARFLFRARIDSLRNDVLRAYWPITNPAAPAGARPPAIVYNPPQFAPFPAVMYCFATVDYFSGFWAGGNRTPVDGRNQTDRMVDFLCSYLRYPRREAHVAINIWRHKLMHTAEPRIVTTGETPPRVFRWLCGPDLDGHMRLRQDDLAKREFVLPFACNEFARDLEEGVFGPLGYFTALLRNENYGPTPAPAGPPHTLQDNYVRCFTEMDQYQINLVALGL